MKRRIKYEMVTVVKPELEMRNGRLKLIDIGDIVASIAHREIKLITGPMVTDIDVTEVARYDRGASQIMAKISLVLELDKFEHVREKALYTRINDFVHELQVYSPEDQIFEFFRLVLRELNYAQYERILVEDGEYHEHLRIKADMPLDDPVFFKHREYDVCGYFYLSDEEYHRLQEESRQCLEEERARREEELRARDAAVSPETFDAGVYGIITI